MTRNGGLYFTAEFGNEENVQGLFFLSICLIFLDEYGGKVSPPLLHCNQRPSVVTHRINMYFIYQTYLTSV